MNREIEFRAYHKATNKMCQVNLLRLGDGAFLIGLEPEPNQILDDGKVIIEFEGVDNGRYCKMEEFELMQYTGVLDKNNNKIFEGDIVDHIDDNNRSGVVKYCKCKFIISKLFVSQYEYIDLHPNDNIVVVGNIHKDSIAI